MEDDTEAIKHFPALSAAGMFFFFKFFPKLRDNWSSIYM